MPPLQGETLITIQEARQAIPGSVSVDCIYAWIRRGTRHGRLEAVRIGGQIRTTREAVERFLARSNAGLHQADSDR